MSHEETKEPNRAELDCPMPSSVKLALIRLIRPRAEDTTAEELRWLFAGVSDAELQKRLKELQEK